MKAMVMTRQGGPEVIELVDRPEPAPGPGEALVEIAAAGVNFMDTGVRRGLLWTGMPNPSDMTGASLTIDGAFALRFQAGHVPLLAYHVRDHGNVAAAPGINGHGGEIRPPVRAGVQSGPWPGRSPPRWGRTSCGQHLG